MPAGLSQSQNRVAERARTWQVLRCPPEIHAGRTGLLVVRSLRGAFRRGPQPCVDQSMQPRVGLPLCIKEDYERLNEHFAR